MVKESARDFGVRLPVVLFVGPAEALDNETNRERVAKEVSRLLMHENMARDEFVLLGPALAKVGVGQAGSDLRNLMFGYTPEEALLKGVGMTLGLEDESIEPAPEIVKARYWELLLQRSTVDRHNDPLRRWLEHSKDAEEHESRNRRELEENALPSRTEWDTVEQFQEFLSYQPSPESKPVDDADLSAYFKPWSHPASVKTVGRRETELGNVRAFETRRVVQATITAFRGWNGAKTEVDLDANMVIVCGANGAGKSSLIDAIATVLQGCRLDLNALDSYKPRDLSGSLDSDVPWAALEISATNKDFGSTDSVVLSQAELLRQRQCLGLDKAKGSSEGNSIEAGDAQAQKQPWPHTFGVDLDRSSGLVRLGSASGLADHSEAEWIDAYYQIQRLNRGAHALFAEEVPAYVEDLVADGAQTAHEVLGDIGVLRKSYADAIDDELERANKRLAEVQAQYKEIDAADVELRRDDVYLDLHRLRDLCVGVVELVQAFDARLEDPEIREEVSRIRKEPRLEPGERSDDAEEKVARVAGVIKSVDRFAALSHNRLASKQIDQLDESWIAAFSSVCEEMRRKEAGKPSHKDSDRRVATVAELSSRLDELTRRRAEIENSPYFQLSKQQGTFSGLKAAGGHFSDLAQQCASWIVLWEQIEKTMVPEATRGEDACPPPLRELRRVNPGLARECSQYCTNLIEECNRKQREYVEIGTRMQEIQAELDRASSSELADRVGEQLAKIRGLLVRQTAARRRLQDRGQRLSLGLEIGKYGLRIERLKGARTRLASAMASDRVKDSFLRSVNFIGATFSSGDSVFPLQNGKSSADESKHDTSSWSRISDSIVGHRGQGVTEFSTGQKHQLAVSVMLAQASLVRRCVQTRDSRPRVATLLIDDLDSAHDRRNLLRDAVLWRRVAYDLNGWQLILCIHDEQIAEQLAELLIPPRDMSLKLVYLRPNPENHGSPVVEVKTYMDSETWIPRTSTGSMANSTEEVCGKIFKALLRRLNSSRNVG
jgi:energy-coupling factor transporter ATP-binding protein EcfA2